MNKTCMKNGLRVFLIALFLCAITLAAGRPVSAAGLSSSNYSSSYRGSKYYTALKNVTLTGNQRTDILAVACSQLGYAEGNKSGQYDGAVISTGNKGNYTEYGRYFGDAGDNWCSEFASWCAINAEIPSSVFKPSTAACAWAFGAPYCKWTETKYSKGSESVLPGDLVLFVWDSTGTSTSATYLDHTAIVYSVEKDSDSGLVIVTVLHGNHTKGQVAKTDYYVDPSTGKCSDRRGNENSTGKIVYVVKPNYEVADLDTPSITGLTNVSSGVKIRWTEISGATGYEIYRKKGSGSYSKLKTVKNTSYYIDTSAKAGTNYTYYVKAYDSSTSKKSGSEKIRRLKNGVITSVTNTSSGIKLKWKKVTGATGYYIRRSTDFEYYDEVHTEKKSKTVSYTDPWKLTTGKVYSYEVVPYYEYSDGTIVEGGTSAVTTARLVAPSISSVKNSAAGKMTVKLKKKCKGTGYQIQYSTSSSFKSKKSVTVKGASTLSKKISGLKKGKTYYVRVRSYKKYSGKKYYSAWSSKKSVRISR